MKKRCLIRKTSQKGVGEGEGDLPASPTDALKAERRPIGHHLFPPYHTI